jgi:hypothetical protein
MFKRKARQAVAAALAAIIILSARAAELGFKRASGDFRFDTSL